MLTILTNSSESEKKTTSQSHNRLKQYLEKIRISLKPISKLFKKIVVKFTTAVNLITELF